MALLARTRLLCGLLTLVWCCDVSLAAEKNILFFITDDQSLTLGCYGDSVAHSPNLDRFAADGILFRNAFATTASCSASRSVIMSGLHNHKNGQYGHAHHFHKFASYPNVISLALPRVMQMAGYRTALIGKHHVSPESVYHFEHYLEGPARNPLQMAENCRDFLTDPKDSRPFFLYFATTDPHRSDTIDESSALELKPDLFGNLPGRSAHPGTTEVFFAPEQVEVPPFLPDTKETRAELAQYYQACARVDAAFGRLVKILQENDLFDRTLIVFTSDHGMAFAGSKTTVYEAGLRVPLIVRNPYLEKRGVETEALVSHLDITPSLLDFAGGLDPQTNGPRQWQDPNRYWRDQDQWQRDNRDGGNQFRSYQGRSWMHLLAAPQNEHWQTLFASHTFHEIQMYYPMRVVRDSRYKLIWNIASGLAFPFASDLWAASSWQAQYRLGLAAQYGSRTVQAYLHRPPFELYDIATDPHETNNLAKDPAYATLLQRYQALLRKQQEEFEDPWMLKWEYE